MPSGGDFTSLDACIDHLVSTHSNLVTADVWADVEIKGDWSASSDTTAVDLLGITTDATRYINIYTDASNRPLASAWTTARYQLTISDASALGLRAQYIYVNGLQIEVYGTTGNSKVCLSTQTIAAGGSHLEVGNCRVRLANGEGYLSNLLEISDGDISGYNIYNSIFYARSDNAGTVDGGYLAGTGDAGNYNLYNCIIYGTRRATRYVTNDKVALYDCALFNNTDDFYNTTNWYAVDYCAHVEAAVTGETNEVAESGGGASWPDDFEGAAAGDFRLKITSNLVDAGGGTGHDLFTDDIEGNSRDADGVNWDVGAYEYAAGGATEVPIASLSAAPEIPDINIKRLRLLSMSSLSALTTVGAADLTRLRKLQFTELIALTTVNPIIIKRLRKLLFAGMSSDSEVAAFLVSTTKLILLAALSCESQVSAPTLKRIRQLAITALSSLTSVSSFTLDRLRHIAIANLESDTTVEDVLVTLIGFVAVAIANVSAESAVDAITLKRMRSIVLTALAADTELESLILKRLRQIGIADLSSLTEIANIDVRLAGEMIQRLKGLLLNVY